jgi:hypothetical protein
MDETLAHQPGRGDFVRFKYSKIPRNGVVVSDSTGRTSEARFEIWLEPSGIALRGSSARLTRLAELPKERDENRLAQNGDLLLAQGEGLAAA